MDTTCCYARQDKIWVHDPDGTPWEVFVTHEASEEEGRPSTSRRAGPVQDRPTTVGAGGDEVRCC